MIKSVELSHNSNRFEEGKFRKRIQFMYGGKIQKVRFRYKGPDIDSILDRLPTAQILDETDGEYIVGAEVFGTGLICGFVVRGLY